MSGLGDVLENAAIDRWVRSFRRSPAQANAPHESDAELITIDGLPDHYLAMTIDTVVEEMSAGLYRRPHTMGWVAAMSSLSDLAAVGATPLGLLISVSATDARDASFAAEAAGGIEEACRSCGVFVLGGDLNESATVSLTGCAVGVVPRGSFITRRGARPGDEVFVTAPVGSGNALGLVRVAELPDDAYPEERYRPVARLAAGAVLRGRARAAMDTSDGLLATLDQLARLNGCGFDLEFEWGDVLASDVLALCESTSTPAWMMLAGPHGEFELVYAAGPEESGAIAKDLERTGLSPVRLGTVREETGLTLALPGGRHADMDMAPIRNLAVATGGNARDYLGKLRDLGRSWGIE